MDYNKASLALHKKLKGKLAIVSKTPIKTKTDLSIAYTPGVAAVSRALAHDTSLARTMSLKANAVAVVSDGSAVLGLGNIGPYGALPVMEGKAVLFKTFGDVDAYPICLDTQDTEEIIRTIKAIAPGFGGINLEDISAPRCFEIEARLKQELDIPVMHDDQHGTAIVVLAALINALKVVHKNKNAVHIVINGAGSAAIAIAELLILYGCNPHTIYMVDSKGIVSTRRDDLNSYKLRIAKKTNKEKRVGTLADALIGADVFIGVSVADVLTPTHISTMAPKPIVFAMANPNPEISYEDAQNSAIAVFGTGRSDYPNQINNVLAFPGIFRGALDCGAKQITENMKLAASEAIAKLVTKKELTATYVIPNPFDPRVAKSVARAVKQAYKTT